jgi:hypothetical protein
MGRPSSSSVTLAGQPKERRSSMQIAILGINLPRIAAAPWDWTIAGTSSFVGA